MSLLDRLAHLMPHSVSVEPRAGEERGDPKYGEPFTMAPAQWTDAPVRYRDDRGETVVGAGAVIVPPTPELIGTERVTLPNGKAVLATQIERYPDASGVCVQRIIYG